MELWKAVDERNLLLSEAGVGGAIRSRAGQIVAAEMTPAGGDNASVASDGGSSCVGSRRIEFALPLYT
jgi:hypothetical protein